MNYQTGDYIRFHTLEQWQQIVEKLERDGERVYGDHFKQNTKAFYLDRDSTWYRVYSYEDYLPEATEDITDKFFEELLQEDLCNNPPLEVGDEFTLSVDVFPLKSICKVLNNGDVRVFCNWFYHRTDTHSQFLKDLEAGRVKIVHGSYKQANPVQEYCTKTLKNTYEAFRNVDLEDTFSAYWSGFSKFTMTVPFEPKKLLVSLSGKACPRYYSMTVVGGELLEMLEQGFTLAETNQWYFAGYATSGKSYNILIDMAGQYIYQNTPHLTKYGSGNVVAIKSIKPLEGKLDLDVSLEKIDLISDNEQSMLIAEALNEEEYQKWLRCVESHHKMMLEAEKEYRAECFKVIESLK